jgi:hypothetical protein
MPYSRQRILFRYAVLRHWSPICAEAQGTGWYSSALDARLWFIFSAFRLSLPYISRQTSIVHHVHNPILYLSYVSILKAFVPWSILSALHSLYTQASFSNPSPIVGNTIASVSVDLFLKTSASWKQHFEIWNVCTAYILQRRQMWNVLSSFAVSLHYWFVQVKVDEYALISTRKSLQKFCNGKPFLFVTEDYSNSASVKWIQSMKPFYLQKNYRDSCELARLSNFLSPLQWYIILGSQFISSVVLFIY